MFRTDKNSRASWVELSRVGRYDQAFWLLSYSWSTDSEATLTYWLRSGYEEQEQIRVRATNLLVLEVSVELSNIGVGVVERLLQVLDLDDLGVKVRLGLTQLSLQFVLLATFTLYLICLHLNVLLHLHIRIAAVLNFTNLTFLPYASSYKISRKSDNQETNVSVNGGGDYKIDRHCYIDSLFAGLISCPSPT